jgi:S-adenosylmethionine:tRNA ribosyltransferase-isomerase
MLTRDFDYCLPRGLIAQQPMAERDASRLLHLARDGRIADLMIRDLPSLVRPGDLWVINDTRVMPARLLGEKATGGKVEILLLEPVDETHVWLAWGKSNKPLRPGTRIHFADDFSGEVLMRAGKEIQIRLLASDVVEAIEKYGHMPLPPYIDRPDRDEDKNRYQTVYARQSGAIAAPTAGLHLTHELMAGMRAKGAEFAHVTLHVGVGTFQPVQVERVEDHIMHEEAYFVPEKTAALVNAALSEGRRVIAVGTTSLRTLEAAFADGRVRAGAGRTSIFIYPGFRFRVTRALLTNFHLPRSTLLMLVCALGGRKTVLEAYEHAKQAGYRFYSYGDAMFLGRMPD